MATYRMCEPPLPEEQAARSRYGLIAIVLAAATVALGYYAPKPWSGAAGATGALSFLLGFCYMRYAKLRARRAYTLDDVGVRKEPVGAGLTLLRWDEITGFSERSGGLVLLTADRLRRLPIPAGLEGIETLRAELVRRRLAPVEDTQQNRNRSDFAVWMGLLAAAFGGIFQARTQTEFLIAVVAGAAAMIALQFRSGRVSRSRWAGWDLLLTWIIAVTDVYSRHFHGHVARSMLYAVVLANLAAIAATVVGKFRRKKLAPATTP